MITFEVLWMLAKEPIPYHIQEEINSQLESFEVVIRRPTPAEKLAIGDDGTVLPLRLNSKSDMARDIIQKILDKYNSRLTKD